ncbi:isochorismatase family protein [Chromobacterium sp. IIBBL 290-4]|uniref:isochorismatase family protein n=1 Tax=Chromobacterium sp. IIBBL 290-4 TaxID=2953890 RepID=UPI0020B8024B|nr:isochorismatase family protein [Chromobacterium sp. IIBBL 290-4]UTH76296.1 isochorismatase family protein [Chromobacterium sp. IIBBL 290-4]
MAGIPQIQHYALPAASDLPENLVSWRLEPSRALLLIHDMQNYFLSPLPAALRDTLLARVAGLLGRCRAAGIPVAYTAHTGRMTREERGLLLDFWGPGMETTPADRDIADAVRPDEGDWLFAKWRYSAFHRTELLNKMRAAGKDQLILCGVYAHIGIQATAVEAYSNDIQAFLVADGVADFSERQHLQMLEYIAQCCGKIVVAEEALA